MGFNSACFDLKVGINSFMKILLLGEFSAVYSNLKDGLIELNYDVTLASNGDGYKDIGNNDIFLKSNYRGIVGKLDNRLKPIRSLNFLKGYDVVQLINPFVFKFRGFPAFWFYKQVKKNNKKMYLSAIGSDAYYWQIARKKLKYGPFEDNLKYDYKAQVCEMQSHSAMKFNKSVIDICDGIIANNYDYEIGYKHEKKLLPSIPLPLNLNKITYKKNKVLDKLIVFHGLSRYGFKGTRHVEEAFKILANKHPNRLELIIEGKLPLADYLKLLSRSNIVIDQVYTYSQGMNALYAMAMGKVVLSGAEPEALSTFGIESTPAINALPSADNIVQIIEKFLFNPSLVEKIGALSRDYVDKNHNHRKIAQRYLEIWHLNQ